MKPSYETAPTLETERLVLRAHRLSDFADGAAMWSEEEVVRHISAKPFTQEETWSRLLRYSGHWKLLGFGYWAVELRERGEFIGEVGFADYHRDLTPSQEGVPEAGWVLKSSAHGSGYATEAVARIVAWADENLEQDQTFCMIDPGHGGSIKVARKVGYADDAMGTYLGESVLFLFRSRAAA